MRYWVRIILAMILLSSCRREAPVGASEDSESPETFGAYHAVLAGSTQSMYERMIFAELAPSITDEMSRRILPRGGSLGMYVDRGGAHIGFVLFGEDVLCVYTNRNSKFVRAAFMNVNDGDGTVGDWQRLHRAMLEQRVSDFYDGKIVPN